MYRFYQKNNLGFSLICIAAYVVLFSVSDSLSETLHMEKLITAPAALLLTLFLYGFLRKNGLKEEYGLYPLQGNPKDFLYFLPLLLILSVNFWNGAAVSVSLPEALLFIASMLCVGFLEEIIFRGLLFKAISRDNIKLAVFVSSITFGIGHIVNLLNGAELLPTLLQICYATAIGFLFAVIFLRGKSLWPCIVTHGVMNATSLFGVSGSRTQELAAAAFLCVVSAGYALWILKHTKGTQEI